MQVTQFEMRQPDDFHVHVRDGELLEEVLPYTVRRFGRALIMPNLKDPITCGTNARFYEEKIRKLACKVDGGDNFRPLMTIKLTPGTEVQHIKSAFSCGVKAAKLYPDGVTTNSEGGFKDLAAIDEKVLNAMQDCGMVLSVHGEVPGVFTMQREAAFLPMLQSVVRTHPNLKIVLEHVTTADAVNWVKYQQSGNIAATITPHHLVMTLDDIVGDKLNPHNFCKPIAKTPNDRTALIEAAKSSPKFFLGTDSAPHDVSTKECAHGCAGCYTAPLAVELTATIFEKANALHALEAFASERGARFYGIPLNERLITLNRIPWKVPARYGKVVPFMAGETIPWSLPFTQGEVGANPGLPDPMWNT